MVDDVSHPAARRGRPAVSGRTRLTVRVHARARTERLEWDGSTLQLATGGLTQLGPRAAASQHSGDIFGIAAGDYPAGSG
jgi:hypothetical protein